MEWDHKHVKYNMSGVFRLATKFLKNKVEITIIFKVLKLLPKSHSHS